MLLSVDCLAFVNFHYRTFKFFPIVKVSQSVTSFPISEIACSGSPSIIHGKTIDCFTVVHFSVPIFLLELSNLNAKMMFSTFYENHRLSRNVYLYFSWCIYQHLLIVSLTDYCCQIKASKKSCSLRCPVQS